MSQNKKIIFALGIIVVFFVTRITGILKIPIFTDEAIYLRWSQIASYDPSWRFISLVDGKQPMFMWVTMVVMRIIKDPLLAGRLVSVFCGFGSLVGLFLLSYELFKNSFISFLTSLIYLILPLTLFYDKLALVDSMLTMFGVWSLWLAVKLAKRQQLDLSLLLGASLGFAYLTKSPAVFFLILSFLAIIFISPKTSVKKGLKFIGFFLLSLLISQAVYNVLRLSPLMHMIGQKNSFFVRSFNKVLTDPFVFFWGNLKGLGGWIVGYFSWPLIIAAFLALILKPKLFFKEKAFLLAWFLGPIIAYGFFAKVMYPRYILFFTPSLIILIAYTLSVVFFLIRSKFSSSVFHHLFFVICFLLFVPILKTSFMLVYNPVEAKIPQADKGQFFDSQFSGGGIKEAVEFFKQKTINKKVTLYTEGTFGLLPYAIELYFYDNPNIKIVGVWPLGEIPSDKIKYEKERENYIIINETQKIKKSWPLEKVFAIKKGKSNKYLRLFKIISNEAD